MNNRIAIIKRTVSKATGRTGLKIKKYSPEILMGIGVVGIVSSTVLACKATLKVDEVITDAEEKITRIKNTNESLAFTEEEYSATDYKKDMTIVYVQTGVEFAKLYGPAILLGTASISCILGSHVIMKKRNIALMAAYKTIEQAFGNYRKRVVDKYGEEIDHNFKHGITKEKMTVIEEDENGKKKKVKKEVDIYDPSNVSIYAKFFDESSTQWSKTPEYNMLFLKCQQNYANDLLKSRGHIFLNEVYDMLGIPRTNAGSVVGWILGRGDDFVDFGMYNLEYEPSRDFVNGYERSILLDFNVDGIVYDLI